MTNDVVTFELTSVAKCGPIKFEIRDLRTDEVIAVGTSISKHIPEIASRYDLDQLICFKWSHENFLSFTPTTVRKWLGTTAAIRGVARADRKREIEGYRNKETNAW